MAVFTKAIIDLTTADIDKVVADQLPESSELEFKQEFELDASGKIRDSSRNDIAKEIVAFANADGGTLIIGIVESDDDPHRAADFLLVADCNAQTERLRRAIYEIIEPKLPFLHACGIEMDGSAGVIVFSVPASHRAPHRLEASKECFRRANNESRKMTMREIQELTLSVASQAGRIDQRFAALDTERTAFVNEFKAQIGNFDNAFWMAMAAVPLNAISLGRVVRRAELAPAMPVVKFMLLGEPWRHDYPWGREHRRGVPIVRGERRTMISSNKGMLDEIYSDGCANIAMLAPGANRVFVGWLISQIATMLQTIQMLRRAAGAADTEYAVAVDIRTTGPSPIALSFGESFDFRMGETYHFPQRTLTFPRYSFGPDAEAPILIGEILQDILHAAGFSHEMDWGIDFE